MARADIVTGILLVALGIGAVVESLRMPRFEHLGVNPYTVPGLVPGLLGAILAFLGALLAVRASRARTQSDAKPVAGEPQADDRWLANGWARLLVCLALTVGYAAGLVGQMPFWLATALFVFVFIVAFEWRLGVAAAQRGRLALAAVIEAAIVSAAVTLVFRYLFLVTLP